MIQPHKKPFLIVFVSCLLLMISVHWTGYDLSIDWEVITSAEVVEFPAWSSQTDLATYEITGEKYLLTEQYIGGKVSRELLFDQIILGFIWLTICVTLSAATYLHRYAFFAVLGLFVLFINRLSLFELGLFGIQAKLVVVIPFLLFATPLVIFHEYKKKTNFLIRLSSLIIVSIVILFGVSDYALFTDHFIAHSLFGLTICGLFFLFFLSEEIIFAILYLTTGKGGKSNHIHFSLLSVIYLGNLILYYLNRSGFFENSLHFFEPFVLLLLSSLVSIWSISFKVNYFSKYVSSNVFHILFFGLGIITMLFLTLHILRGNDAVYEAFHYFILYFHIGFGVLFFLYIIGNFIDPLIGGFEIFKIVYKERNFPYATARIGGLVIILAFYFLANQEPYNLLRSGYYNYLSEVSKREGNELLSKEYLLQASFLGYNTHFANYVLGFQEREKGNEFAAKSYFYSAAQRFPSSYALVNYGNLDETVNFNKVQVSYEEALRRNANNEILNNLGLLQMQKDQFEEALESFEKCIPSSRWNNAPMVNKWNVSMKTGIVDSSSLIPDYSSGNHGVKSNILFAQNQSTVLTFDSTNLSQAKFLHRHGYLLNSAYLLKHDSIESYLRSEIAKSLDANSNDRLSKALALHLYQKGDINKAFMMLDYLQANTHQINQGEYLDAMGKFALDQHAYQLAIDFFDKALEVKHTSSIFGKLDALAQLDKQKEIPVVLLRFLKRHPELTKQVNDFLDKLETFTSEKKKERTTPKLDSLSVDQLINLGRKNAFHEQQVLKVIHELKKRESSGGYEILVDAIEINPYSAKLLVSYAFAALDWGLYDYADQSIVKLKDLIPNNEFQLINERFEQRKEEMRNSTW